MPSKNRNKIFVSDSYYHVYNRGVEKRIVFKDESDYAVFLNLLKRYLSNEETKDSKGRIYPNYYGRVELIAFLSDAKPLSFALLCERRRGSSSIAACRERIICEVF